MPTVERPLLAPAIRPYQWQWLRADVLAGLAAGAVIIPQAMAYATVANLPPQIGLYTCMVPLVVYAFIGGSRGASVTTTSTIATLTASTMLAAGVAAGAADAQPTLITLTLLVGLLLLLARLLRLGSIIENINEATLTGLKAGVGLTVAAAQLPKLLGVAPDPNEDGFFRVLWSALRQLDHAHGATIALSVASIAILLAISRFLPAIPGPLVVAALGIGLATAGGLASKGVQLIPEVPEGIPMPGLPDLSHVTGLLPGALAIAMMTFLETVAVARSVRSRDQPQIDADRELSATGLASVLGSFCHALPAAGGFSQTLVNVRAGARSQLASLVTVALAVLVALFLAPVLSKLPQATLGAMVFVAVLGLIDIPALVRLFHFDRQEFSLAAIVAVLGLTAGLLPAVAAGVVLTLYSVLHTANQRHVVQVVRGQDDTWADSPEGATAQPTDPFVVRTQLGLYTANLRENCDEISRLVLSCDPRPKTLIWDLSRQPRATSTILDALRDFETELATDGIRVLYAALPDPARTTAKRWPWWAELERQHRVFPTVAEASDASLPPAP